MATFVVNSTSRALRLMISIFNTTGGLSYKVYTKLYEAIVWPTISYEKVQVGKDQEKAQSEKDSHSKNRGGKKPN